VNHTQHAPLTSQLSAIATQLAAQGQGLRRCRRFREEAPASGGGAEIFVAGAESSMRGRVRRQSSSQSPGDRCRYSTIALVAAGSVRTRGIARVACESTRFTITSLCLRGRVLIGRRAASPRVFFFSLRRVTHTIHCVYARALTPSPTS